VLCAGRPVPAGSVYQAAVLVPLLKTGKRADGEVVRIETGEEGDKRAVLRFVTDTGDSAVLRDLFEMMPFRFSKGDRVTVLYEPSDTGIATMDSGLWTWQQPVSFLAGFVLLPVPGTMLPRLVKRATGHD